MRTRPDRVRVGLRVGLMPLLRAIVGLIPLKRVAVGAHKAYIPLKSPHRALNSTRGLSRVALISRVALNFTR